MQGRRLPDSEEGNLPKMEAGDYIYSKLHMVWFVMTPNGMLGSLNSRHDLTIEADGALTVSPSILISHDWESKGRTWHGYLERGIWREC